MNIEERQEIIRDCTEAGIQLAINKLKEVDNACIQQLIGSGHKELGIAEAAWNKTEWHKIIQNKILELEQNLPSWKNNKKDK